ncbi:MAG: IS21 family transposase [Acidobacteriaceae bacterium]|nr:IS21 family transposase [Acidobacteriaceae bacterium]
MELFEKIRCEYFEGVGTILGVAQKLGVHRRMVREAIRTALPAKRKKMQRESSRLIGEVVLFIHQILTADQHVPRKQRHTAQRIYERLRDEMPQQQVSPRSVRRAVQDWKQQRKGERAETYISQHYEPGREGQADWYEAYADLGGERVKLQVFCLRSMYSGAAFHRAYWRAAQQAFLDGHARAFEMFGGAFRVVRYDNLRSAVKQIMRGKRREQTTRFVAFRSHYLFDAEFCTPAHGNEKGGVEQEVGRFRRRWWTPVPQQANLDELNQHLLACCLQDQQRQIEGREQCVAQAFRQEQSQLIQRAAEDFDLNETMSCVVDANRCVSVKYNRYSTPLRPGIRVEVRVDASHVTVHSEGRQIARHERGYLVKQEVLALEHYLGVLEHKPGALAHSKALVQYRQTGLWPPSFDAFWEKLMERQGRSEGTRAMIRLLQLIPAHGHQQLCSAIEGALACGSSDPATVLHLLKPALRSEHHAAPLLGTGVGFERPLPKLDMYDQLLGNKPQREVRA